MSAVQRATQAALDAVNDEIGRSYTRRQFTISKFARHPDGFLHARVVVDGQGFYFHRRYGSWLAPGHINGHAVLKEPEALLGSVLGREVKFTLSDKSAPYDTADRKEREARDAAKRAGHERRVDDPVADDSGLPDGGDSPSLEGAVRSD